MKIKMVYKSNEFNAIYIQFELNMEMVLVTLQTMTNLKFKEKNSRTFLTFHYRTPEQY